MSLFPTLCIEENLGVGCLKDGLAYTQIHNYSLIYIKQNVF